MDTFGNINFSCIAKNLLIKLRAQDITIAELLRECAYWAIKDGFDELKIKPLPTKPHSAAFNEYEMLLPAQRLKIDPSFFIKNSEINSYYYQVNMIRNHNRGTYQWLKEIKTYLPEEDIICLEKINVRLQEFENWMNEENDLIEKAKEVFSAEQV